jgi:hypothetical protein
MAAGKFSEPAGRAISMLSLGFPSEAESTGPFSR